jgi:hypothetical protein
MNEGPLSANETKDLLARLSHMPKKWLGQNFLIDGNIVRKSLELGEVKAGDTVVEVGPGLGTLTRTLLGAGVNLYAGRLNLNNCGSGGASSALGTGTFSIGGGSFDNTSGSTQATNWISPMIGHPFKQGDIVSGGYPKFETTGGTVTLVASYDAATTSATLTGLVPRLNIRTLTPAVVRSNSNDNVFS